MYIGNIICYANNRLKNCHKNPSKLWKKKRTYVTIIRQNKKGEKQWDFLIN